MMQLASLSPLIGAASLALGITSLTVSSAGLARQWPGAYQRIASVVAGLLGLGVLSGSVALFLGFPGQVSHVLTFSGAVGGLTLLAVAAARFKRAPIDRNVTQLRVIAAEMISSLEGNLAPVSKSPTFVELHAIENGGYSATLINRKLRQANESVIAVVGPVGSGKSTTLKTLAREICKETLRRRHPRLIALYVDFATMQPGPRAPTSEMIRKHVLESVSGSDATIRAVLEAALKGDADSADWIFLFDSMDEVATAWPANEIDAQMRSLFEEIRRFLRPGDIRFRAAVAIRDSFTCPPGARTLTIAPLSRRQQKRLMVAAGLRSVSQLKALDRLQTLAADVATRPLTFQLWRERMLKFGSAPSPSASAADSVFQLVSATVAGRLEKIVARSEAYNSIHEVAEHAAAALNTWPASNQPLLRNDLIAEVSRRSGLPTEQVTRSVEALEEADLVARARPNSFVFAHRSFQDYFSAKWLIASFRSFDAGSALTDLRWREATVSALRSGPDELRNRLLSEAEAIVSQRTQALMPDVGEFVSVRPSEPLPVTFPGGGAGPPDPLMLYVLSVVSAAASDIPNLLPQGLSMAADRLVATAFVRDSRPEQRRSLSLLRIMTPEIALRAVERALFLGGMLFDSAIAAWDATKRPVQELSWQARVKLAGGLMERPLLLREFQRRSSEKAAGGVSEFARDLATFGKFSMAILFILTFVNGTVAFAQNHLEAALTGLLAGVTALICLFRWANYRWVHSTSWLDGFVGPVTLLWIIVSALAGAFAVPGLIYGAVTHFSALPVNLIRTYLVTWPACMAAVLLIADAPTRQSWWLPQWFFARPAFEILRTVRPQRWISAGVRDAAPVLGAIALLVLIANMPLPIEEDVEDDARVNLLLAAFGCWILVAYIWRAVRRINDRHFLRMTSRTGDLDSVVLLHRIRAAAGNQARLARMIGGLAKVPRASLAGANEALADLTRALTHVERMVPANTKARIPRGVWDVGPSFTLPEFRQWVEDFDAAHPGRLSWMAAQHVDNLARLVDSGETPRP